MDLNHYLKQVQANNPGLAAYWPGSEQTQQNKPSAKPAVSSETSHTEAKGSNIKAGCIPCSLGHIGVCSSLLQEGVRFAQSDGITADVPIDRVNTCLDELNALERKDLTPELIDTLPPWEKELALKTLASSRKLRHSLESITSLDDLIHASAETTAVRKSIGREWFRRKLSTMSPQEKEALAKEALEQVEQGT